MDQLACIELPAFPIQVLCKKYPQWKSLPVVIVRENKPHGKILWVNRYARKSAIVPGYKYTQALSLEPNLRAAEISTQAIERGCMAVMKILRCFSPQVESCIDKVGVFWLDVSGLFRLYRTPRVWAEEVYARLRASSWDPTIVVGTKRFFTYAIAKNSCDSNTRILVFADTQNERREAFRVSLERLDMPLIAKRTLSKLGIKTIGQFVELPQGAILERFGQEVSVLHQLALGKRWDPLCPTLAPPQFIQSLDLEELETDSHRILFIVKRVLDTLLQSLASYKYALSSLHLRFSLDSVSSPCYVSTIRPMEPTLDVNILLRLIRLRIESHPPLAPIRKVVLTAEEAPATYEQITLFAENPRRSIRAAEQAFSRIRAELGNHSIVRAVLQEGHLPASQYRWETLKQIRFPKPQKMQDSALRRILVRSMYEVPIPFDYSLGGAKSVSKILGSYIVAGGWWGREVHHEYHFIETPEQEWLWVYYDRRNQRWFVQGHIG